MPHSGGGGSSSSGSHSSSHSSSSSGSFSHHSGGGGNSRSGAHYTTVCKSRNSDVYVRYSDDKPEYRYIDRAVYKKASPGRVIRNSLAATAVVAAVLCVLLGVLFWKSAPGRFGAAGPVTEPQENAEWAMIDDQADSFRAEEEEQIRNEIHAFYMETGIETVVETITEQTFTEADKDDLETYAYAEYVNLFSDEDHLLIVFEDMGEEKWAFELMEGDRTSDWLTDDVNAHFDDTFTDHLWASSRYTYGTALAETLRDTTAYIAEAHQSGNGLPKGMFMMLLGTFFNIFIIGAIPVIIFGLMHSRTGAMDQRQMQKEGFMKLNNPVIIINNYGGNEVKMVSCSYCGGSYPYGSSSCPHCGAPVEADPDTASQD